LAHPVDVAQQIHTMAANLWKVIHVRLSMQRTSCQLLFGELVLKNLRIMASAIAKELLIFYWQR